VVVGLVVLILVSMDGLIVATIVEKWVVATAATASSLSCAKNNL